MIALSRTFDAGERREIRMRAIFEAGKLDPRTYDEETIAPFAIRLAPSAWRELASLVEHAWNPAKSARDHRCIDAALGA